MVVKKDFTKTAATYEQLMKHYHRLALMDGRTQEQDYQRFYLFAPRAVIDLHVNRLVPGDPPRIEHGLWFRMFNGVVAEAATAHRLGEAESARELYDITIN